MSALEVESFRPVLTPERNLQSTPYLFWFSGAGCTMDTGLQLRNQLEADDAFGQGNMRFIPSIISVEKPDRAKYDDITRHMIQLSKQGRRIISVVHSFGLVEQAAVFQKIREIDPDFFEQDFTERFDAVVISGVGLHDGFSPHKHIATGLKGVMASFPLGFATPGQGLDSLAVAHHSELEDEVIAEKLRKFFHPAVSHHDDRFDVLHSPHDEIDLDEKVQKAIKTIDGRIMHDFDHKERDRLVEDLQERARATKRYVLERYSGKKGSRLFMVPVESAVKLGKSLLGLQALGYMELVRLLPSFVQQHPRETLQQLEQQGEQIWFIHLEYDSFYDSRKSNTNKRPSTGNYSCRRCYSRLRVFRSFSTSRSLIR